MPAWPAQAPWADWREIGPSEHFVQFYEADAFLLDALGDFIGMALRAGDAGVVIATPAHREGLEERLRAGGLDVDAARAGGRQEPRQFNRGLARDVQVERVVHRQQR